MEATWRWGNHEQWLSQDSQLPHSPYPLQDRPEGAVHVNLHGHTDFTTSTSQIEHPAHGPLKLSSTNRSPNSRLTRIQKIMHARRYFGMQSGWTVDMTILSQREKSVRLFKRQKVTSLCWAINLAARGSCLSKAPLEGVKWRNCCLEVKILKGLPSVWGPGRRHGNLMGYLHGGKEAGVCGLCIPDSLMGCVCVC